MGWFDQQIRQRKLSDQEVLEESLIRMASAVLGKQRAGQFEDQRIVTKAAIDELLKYYHFKPVEIPDNIRDPDEQLEYCLRPHGIMRRSVELKEDWYKDSFGPMIAFRKEDGLPVALIPKPFIGYSFRDAESGKTLSLNRKTAEQFDRDAWCFYRPLPLRELTIPDLMKYLWDCLSTGDYVTLIVLTFAVTALGLLMTSLTKALTMIDELENDFWKDVKVPGDIETFNPEMEKALRLADYFELARLIAADALHRKESCGGHFRTESQTEDGETKRDDEHFMYVAAWQYQGHNQPETLHKEELNYEHIKIATRNYKN